MSVITTGAKSSQRLGGAFLKHPRKQIQSDWLFSNWATHLTCARSKRSLFKHAALVCFQQMMKVVCSNSHWCDIVLKHFKTYMYICDTSVSVWEMLKAANLEDHPQESFSSMYFTLSPLLYSLVHFCFGEKGQLYTSQNMVAVHITTWYKAPVHYNVLKLIIKIY